MRGGDAGARERNAAAVFERLAEAESGVHQQSIEKVHFHEVGAADSIADIVGACLALELLGVEKIVLLAGECGQRHGEDGARRASGPCPGHGDAADRDVPIYSRGPALELTTPTGAAVPTTLAEYFGAMPAMRVEQYRVWRGR